MIVKLKFICLLLPKAQGSKTVALIACKTQQVKQDFKENKFNIRLDANAGMIDSNAFEIIGSNENNYTVKIKDGHKSNDVLKYFIEQNINVEAFNEVLPSLNEIFIKLVADTHAVTRTFQKVN